MNYPRIYSLSTIGILKHYIHDYVFHPKRTDFIGSNGVGKSIIADLLQMIFVYDKELIRFGTDSVKKEDRLINTLPYKTKFAYCFLNIEIEKGKFIAIGIQISNQKGKRIIPFVITKEADLNLKINQLALEKNEILFAKNLTNNGTIPDLQEISEHLLASNGLRLNSFKNNDEVQGYYRFLYDKNITPLNLSQDRNLKAFAKVIQSFSKAKTLNLSGNQASKSLKEFLFEDSDEDILFNFNKAKDDLEKILKQYHSLNEEIKTLSEKQKKLLHLRELEHTYSNLYKYFKQAELNCSFAELQTLKRHETESNNLLIKQQKELEKLIKIIEKIPRVESRIKECHDLADKKLELFNEFEKNSRLIEDLSTEITDLKMIILPEIHEDWKDNVERVDMTLRNNEDIKKSIALATPYIEKYKTFDNITLARDKQTDILDELKSTIKAEKLKKEKLLSLLENNKTEDTLLQWYIHHLPDLNKEQIQALLYFATTPISKTNTPKGQSRYVDAEALFKEFESIKTNEGIWLRLGALWEFIPFNKDATVIENKTDLDKSIQKLIDKLKSELSDLEIKLQALADISDAKSYKIDLFKYPFDISIVENGNINRLKTAIACIFQIEEKNSELHSKKKQLEDALQVIKSELKVKYDDLEAIKEELKITRKKWLDRVTKISKYSGEKTSNKSSKEKEVDKTDRDLKVVIEDVSSKQKIFDDLNKSYFDVFQENITDFNIETTNIEQSKNDFNNAFELYKSSYISACHPFEETSNEKNPSVQLAIKNQSFSFRTLEEALLGSKIRSTDDIIVALSEANQNRTMIADGIRDNMIKIFSTTASRYEKYDEQIKRINTFFINRKISDKFYFKLEFTENKDINIKYVKDIAYKVRQSATQGELQFGHSIVDFIEDFFKKQAKIKDKVPIDKLLDPKTYFELSAKLNYESGEEVSGSTGETYSAIALLGVARLSAMQKEQRKGLRFIILEELGSLDNTNFKTFPDIAEEFKYQIITMAPHTFNIGLSDDWYAHHLIKGKVDDKINYHPSSSYFKTKDNNEDLDIYLNKLS
jgi:DNA repair exonuclease SbcCD ATPase subunit